MRSGVGQKNTVDVKRGRSGRLPSSTTAEIRTPDGGVGNGTFYRVAKRLTIRDWAASRGNRTLRTGERLRPIETLASRAR
jgi:hypothetical protein